MQDRNNDDINYKTLGTTEGEAGLIFTMLCTDPSVDPIYIKPYAKLAKETQPLRQLELFQNLVNYPITSKMQSRTALGDLSSTCAVAHAILWEAQKQNGQAILTNLTNAVGLCLAARKENKGVDALLELHDAVKVVDRVLFFTSNVDELDFETGTMVVVEPVERVMELYKNLVSVTDDYNCDALKNCLVKTDNFVEKYPNTGPRIRRNIMIDIFAHGGMVA